MQDLSSSELINLQTLSATQYLPNAADATYLLEAVLVNNLAALHLRKFPGAKLG